MNHYSEQIDSDYCQITLSGIFVSVNPFLTSGPVRPYLWMNPLSILRVLCDASSFIVFCLDIPVGKPAEANSVEPDQNAAFNLNWSALFGYVANMGSGPKKGFNGKTF